MDDPGKSSNLYSKLSPMLFTSELVYAFAILRNKVDDEVLKRESLIDDEENSYVDEHITVQNVAEFIKLNMEKLNDESRINSDLFIIGLLELSKIKNAHLVHYDAEFSGKTFVYGLLVNDDHKRITLVFRGSSNLGDWKTNAHILKGHLPTPESLKSLGLDPNKKLKVHGGFKDYCFYRSGKDEKQKYSRIKKSILSLYESGNCDGYELFITGHSLGGAVSSLMAFQLAASEKIKPHLRGKPVVNISFASPYVGGKVWSEAFKLLEKAGRVQHIRVSSKKDAVPLLSPTFDYQHVGVNLYLDPSLETKCDIIYRGKRSLWGQWSFSQVKAHSLKQYHTRCKTIGPYIGDLTINEIYEKFCIKYTNEDN